MNSKFERLPIVVEALMVLAVLPFTLTPSTTAWAKASGRSGGRRSDWSDELWNAVR